jgi:hypothetical protein
MPGFDAFDGDSFTLRALTNAMTKPPQQPGQVGKLGLFQPQGVAVRSIVVEELEGTLSVLQTKRPGGPATLKGRTKRKARSFEIPHIPYEDRILAAELQGVRKFGSENELEDMASTVAEHLAEMRQDVEVTHEYHRIGALTGVLLDADGTTIYNLFTEFETAEQTLDMVFGTATTDQRAKGLEIKRMIEAALGATPYGHVHVLCDSTFFDALIGHATIEAAYDRWMSGQYLRDDPRFTGFEFPKGVIWQEYRQAQNTVGTLDFIASGEARAFPVGVPGLFKAYYGPAQFEETVNRKGVPIVAKQVRDPAGRWVDLLVETNPLMMCHRPRCLIKLTSSN